jgi:hypothetical protein
MLLRAEGLDINSALLSRGRRRSGAPKWGSEGQPGTGASGVRTGRERDVRDPLARPESNEPDTAANGMDQGTMINRISSNLSQKAEEAETLFRCPSRAAVPTELIPNVMPKSGSVLC